MKSVNCKQYTSSSNVALGYDVKFNVILSQLFHSHSQIAIKNFFAIVYVLEENLSSSLFSKFFKKRVYHLKQCFLKFTCHVLFLFDMV